LSAEGVVVLVVVLLLFFVELLFFTFIIVRVLQQKRSVCVSVDFRGKKKKR